MQPLFFEEGTTVRAEAESCVLAASHSKEDNIHLIDTINLHFRSSF